jgi:hypothetical protein
VIVPLKATIFQQLTFTIQYINRNFILCLHYYEGDRPQNSVKRLCIPQISVKSLWQAADHQKKTVCMFLPTGTCQNMSLHFST